MQKEVEYLIVGQGLAGTFLAFELLSRGYSFAVVDKSRPSTASKIAAGLINPVALRRLIPTWRAQEFLNHNQDFYGRMSSFLGGKKYHHNISFNKLIESQDERHFWENKRTSSVVENWISPKFFQMTKNLKPQMSFTLGAVKQCYWLELKKLLKDFRVYLQKNAMLVDKDFDYQAVNDKVFEEITFKKIVFCEGIGIKNNPYFNYLPIRLNKGELLTITSNDYYSDQVMKKKMFVLPIGNNHYKIGATYAWQWENEAPEENAKRILKASFKEISQAKFNVELHEAGLRPAVKDRRPLIGAHPLQKHMFVFNGMGSRGCLIAPKLSMELVDHIEHNKSLNSEVDVMRYENLRKV